MSTSIDLPNGQQALVTVLTDASGTLTPGGMPADAGGLSEVKSLSGTDIASSAITTGGAIVSPTVDCYFRAGTTPVAVAGGVDRRLLAYNQYHITGITSGDKLSFITDGAVGSVYITPDA